MTSLSQQELEFLNSACTKEGDIKVLYVDKSERICVISVPIFDGTEDIKLPYKLISVPIDFENWGDGEIDIFNAPDFLNDDDIEYICNEIYYAYEEEL